MAANAGISSLYMQDRDFGMGISEKRIGFSVIPGRF